MASCFCLISTICTGVVCCYESKAETLDVLDEDAHEFEPPSCKSFFKYKSIFWLTVIFMGSSLSYIYTIRYIANKWLFVEYKISSNDSGNIVAVAYGIQIFLVPVFGILGDKFV